MARIFPLKRQYINYYLIQKNRKNPFDGAVEICYTIENFRKLFL